MSATLLAPQPPPADADHQVAMVAALLARRRAGRTGTRQRTGALCAAVGHPQRAYPSIQITGTNGKTSVARMVAALLSAHGVSTGAFTSPHVTDVGERITVDGAPSDRAVFVAGLRSLLPHVERVEATHGQASFFEVLTALACAHFAREDVEAGVFEVGMGGARDATRVVDARVAVLTGVALDHAELGATPAEVAGEKAGIIAPGSTVVSACQEPAVAEVIDRVVQRQGARLLVEGRDFGIWGRSVDVGGPWARGSMPQRGQWLGLHAGASHVADIWLPLAGEHQATNAACALAAAESFLGRRLDADAVRAGFAAVQVPGRLERIDRPGQAPVILDGAHNPAAARALAAGLAAEYPSECEVRAAAARRRRRVVVLGVCADKDVGGIAAALVPVVEHVVTTTTPSPRAIPATELAAVARAHGCPAEPVADVDAAIAHATQLTDTDDLVVVTGSIYTVAAARTVLASPIAPLT